MNASWQTELCETFEKNFAYKSFIVWKIFIHKYVTVYDEYSFMLSYFQLLVERALK